MLKIRRRRSLHVKRENQKPVIQIPKNILPTAILVKVLKFMKTL